MKPKNKIAAEALNRAIELAGGTQVALAKLIGAHQQKVSEWVGRGYVPYTKVLPIERALKGQVTRYELRPDLYPRDEAA